MAARYPFIEHVGLRFEPPRPGWSRCTLELAPVHLNGNGVVHGGAIFTLAEGERCATIEVKINYFRPVTEGTLVCTTELVYRGRSVANLEATVRLGEQIVAKANGSFSIFRPRGDAAPD